MSDLNTDNRIQTDNDPEEIGYDINTGNKTNLSLLLKKRKRLIQLLVLIIVIYLVVFFLSQPSITNNRDDISEGLNVNKESSTSQSSNNEINKLVQEAIENSLLTSDQISKIKDKSSSNISSTLPNNNSYKEDSSNKINSSTSSLSSNSENNASNTIDDKIKSILALDPIVDTNDYTAYKRFNRNDNDFTQGLYFDSDYTLVESTGLNKLSKLKKYDFFDPSNIYWSLKLEDQYFGEGCDQIGDTIYQLTYKNKKIFKYKAVDFASVKSTTSTEELQKLHSTNPTLSALIDQDKEIVEGWGITHDDKKIYISDSTSTVKIVDINDPDFKVIGKLNIRKNGLIVNNLNELEFAHGKIYGNIWLQDKIVIINPENGEVEKIIDFSDLVRYEKNNKFKGNDMNVLNGIAYNKRWDFFIITGKNWTGMYFVKFK